jgi:hypothetical protein
MKLLMIIVEEAHKEELEVFLERSGVAGYSEIPHVIGRGMTGPRLGSGAFPKTSAIIFTAIEPEAIGDLRRGLDDFCAQCGERVKMMVWGVEQVL